MLPLPPLAASSVSQRLPMLPLLAFVLRLPSSAPSLLVPILLTVPGPLRLAPSLVLLQVWHVLPLVVYLQ